MKITTILYSGFTGTAAVAFSLIETDRVNIHTLIFIGIEKVPQAYEERCRTLGVKYYEVLKRPGSDLAAQKKLRGFLGIIQPRAVILHSLSAIFTVYYYSLFRRVTIIAVEHQTNAIKTKKDLVRSYLAMLLARRVVYLTDLYSSEMKKILGPLFFASKVSIIPNGVDVPEVSPHFPSSTGTVRIGMLARLVDIKDHLTLIRAFALLNNNAKNSQRLLLLIAGSGPMKEQLEDEVKIRGISDAVNFCGFLNDSESAAFLRSLDIYVHASFGETMSTAIMQAMASAKAIVASDVPGINNMITHYQTGMLVPVRDAAALAESLQFLINNPHISTKLSAAAYQYAHTRFSAVTMFNKYAALLPADIA